MPVYRTLIVTAALMLLLAAGGMAPAQMAGPQGRQGGPRGMQQSVVVGRIVSLDQKTLTLSTGPEGTRQFQVTAATSFLKEAAGDKYDLVVGAAVQMMGQSTGQNMMAPALIRVVDAIDEPARQANASGPPGPRGGPQGRGPQGPQGTGGGPVTGAVIKRDPLMVQSANGIITMATPNESTRITVERMVAPADATPGMTVRVRFSPRQGLSVPEASRIVVLMEQLPPAPAMRERKF